MLYKKHSVRKNIELEKSCNEEKTKGDRNNEKDKNDEGGKRSVKSREKEKCIGIRENDRKTLN